VALIDTARRLVLVAPDGSRRVLAREAGAPPVSGHAGELFYVARYGVSAEVHRLQADGSDRVLADGLSNAGVLTPERDGALLFVGARNGGVAGIWRVDTQSLASSAAHCLTNCELQTGAPWGNAYQPPPGSQEALRDAYARLNAVAPASDKAIPASRTPNHTPNLLGEQP
jgi:hypothetical protein